MTDNEKNIEIFKCPKCGEPTWDDSIGYNPPVPECLKCKHLCNWQYPEREASGFDDRYKEAQQKTKELINKLKEHSSRIDEIGFGFHCGVQFMREEAKRDKP